MVAEWCGASLASDADRDRMITDVAALDQAGPGDLTFLDNPRYLNDFRSTRAEAALVAARHAEAAPPGCAILIVREPYRAMAMAMAKLFPTAVRPGPVFNETGVSPAAFVHPSARLEAGVVVEPGAVIGRGAEIGAGTIIGPNAVIGPEVRIGRDGAIGASTTITAALIGDRVLIHPGVHIGQDGFGFALGPRGHLKVPQIGRVIIQDDVEIGAGATIDRGANRDTVIGEGAKIDNLVQIGHNVVIGRHAVLVSQSGVLGIEHDRRFRRARRSGRHCRPSEDRRGRSGCGCSRRDDRHSSGRALGRRARETCSRVLSRGRSGQETRRRENRWRRIRIRPMSRWMRHAGKRAE